MKEKLEVLKQINNKIEVSKEKSKRCKSCKKKVVEKLPEPTDTELFTIEDIKFAYYELTNMGGVNPIHKPLIESVYLYIFNEKFDWDCGGCTSIQVRKFHNHLKHKLKIKL